MKPLVGRNKRVALAAVGEAINMDGRPRHDLALNRYVDATRFEDAASRFRALTPHLKSKHQATRFDEALRALIAGGYVRECAGWLWILTR